MKRIFLLFLITLTSLSVLSCKEKKENTISASGTLDATQVKISSKIGGRISKMYVEEGDKIKKGQILFDMDCKELRLQLEQAELNYELAKVQHRLISKGARKEDIEQNRFSIEILKTNLDVAMNDYERARRLFSANAISQKALEDAELRVKVIEKQISAAEENLKKIKSISREEEIEVAKLRVDTSKVSIDILKERLSDCTVSSPIDGIISKKIYNEGEIVAPSNTVYLITDPLSIYLKIYLPLEEVFKVKIGDEMIVRVDGQNRDFIGRITYISDEAEFTPKNIQTRDERVKLVFMVKVLVDNKDGILKPGLPADAYLVNKK